MSENVSFSLQQLGSALQTLLQQSRLPASAPIDIQVTVQKSADNTVTLVTDSGKITVQSADLFQQLQNNQSYRLQLSPQQNVLQFIAQDVSQSVALEISPKLAAQLLSVPASQLRFAAGTPLSIPVEVGQITNQKIELLLKIPVNSENQLNSVVMPKAPQLELPTSHNFKPPELNLGTQTSVYLQTDKTHNFKSGQLLILELKPQAQNWVVELRDNQNRRSRPVPLDIQVATDILTKLTQQRALNLPTQANAQLSPELLQLKPIQAVLANPNIKQHNQQSDAIKSLTLSIIQSKPVLTLTIENEPAVVLTAQNKQFENIKQFLTAQTNDKSGQSQSTLNKSPNVLNTQNHHSDGVKSESASPQQHSTTRANTTASVSPAKVAQLFQELNMRLMPQQTSPNLLLNQIQNALISEELPLNNELKNLLETKLRQVEQAQPKSQAQDWLHIRNLITTPTLPLSVNQLLSPPPTQGFIAGLIALLQLSLSARLSRSNPEQRQQINELFSKISSTSTTSSAGVRDMAQLEQKADLSKTIAKLIANHQASKLSSAEQQLQGQEQLYYQFSTGNTPHNKDIELLIKRAPEQDSSKKKTVSENKLWQLSMKLTLGDMGDMLVKAKLNQSELELDIYTSNQTTKDQVLNFLPLLKKRFDSLNIQLARSAVQLGKIPSSLQRKPYQLIEMQA